MRHPFASEIIAELGPEMGIEVELEPEFKFAGELVFPNGRRHLFRNTNFNVNSAGSTEIAKDKHYTNFFLNKHGLHVPRSKAFFSIELNRRIAATSQRGISEAVEYAEALGFPVFVKPNNLSQGAFVTKAFLPVDITNVAPRIFERTDVLLVEEFCVGRDYRIVVLGDKIISAYERIPLTVVGDGVSMVDLLLAQARSELGASGRPNSEIVPDDPRIDIKLRQLGKNRHWVPMLGQKIALLDNANLSTGGKSVDVTDSVHESFREIAIHATKVLGLRLCGVDIICANLTQTADAQTWNIIELNAAPGLDNYASLGSTQRERVKDLYRQIIDYLSTLDL